MMTDLFDAITAPQPVDTRAAAYERAAETAPQLRAKIMRYMQRLASGGHSGLTADECAANLGMSLLSVRPRFSEMKRDGLISDTGKRRQNKSGNTAKVWALTDAGKAFTPAADAAPLERRSG